MSEKILVVDDEEDLELIINQKYRKQIRDNIYEFFFARNGVEALAILKSRSDISIVLTDINMPEMDGLTLLNCISEMKNPLLKSIIISAYDDMDNIRTAMNRGAFDFITKPIDLNDLTTTIDRTVEQLNITRESMSEHEMLRSLRHDLDVARKIQQSFLPKSNTLNVGSKHIDVFGVMKPAHQIGGDFYDFFTIDQDRVGLVVGDVSGKGVSAAMFMGVSRILIRAAGQRGFSSSDCITYVNKIICGDATESMFTTAFYAILNLTNGEIDYTNAGHTAPMVLKNNGSVETFPLTNNTVIGIFDQFEFQNRIYQLSKGDTLLICTDGMTESFNIHNEIFGKERLLKNLESMTGNSPQQIVESLMQAVIDFEQNAKRTDDVTLLAAKYQ